MVLYYETTTWKYYLCVNSLRLYTQQHRLDQRKIPLDVQPLYDGLKSIKLNLETNNPSEIAPKVDALNKKYDTNWEGLRDGNIITPHSVKDAAKKLLKDYELNPLPARNPSLCQELLGAI